MTKLKRIVVDGFKSIGHDTAITFDDITVFLGANGSGKSNLVSFFKMLNYLSSGALQKYVAESGMASSVLHFGPERTKAMDFFLEFEDGEWLDSYKAALSYFAPDGLFFSEEHVIAAKMGSIAPIEEFLPSAGRLESQLSVGEPSNSAYKKARAAIVRMMNGCKAFQFHNTSANSSIRSSCYIEHGAYLRGDAGNLPAFLAAMKSTSPEYYGRVVCAIREVVPQFRDFVLEPSSRNQSQIFLNWVGEDGDKYLFGPHQFSDGMIRFIALAALLLQPESKRPAVIVLDEPELGLHPAAIQSLAGMVEIASKGSQIVLSTQSAELAAMFPLESIRIVDYNQASHCSQFKSLPVDEVKRWMDDYSFPEIWEKNIIGGRP